jgi:hypothetical protein
VAVCYTFARYGRPDEFTFEIEPVKQTVRASVEARFRIAEPDLSRVAP